MARNYKAQAEAQAAYEQRQINQGLEQLRIRNVPQGLKQTWSKTAKQYKITQAQLIEISLELLANYPGEKLDNIIARVKN